MFHARDTRGSRPPTLDAFISRSRASRRRHPRSRHPLRSRADKAGFVVRVATTGEDALRLARETLPDCAVIDLRLPDMSGWDLCREIRKPQPGEPPAIIVLTPEVSKMCAENSAKIGCNAWLAHPMHADDLVRTVRHVLNAETDAPASLDEALLGSRKCPGCESESVRATLRVGSAQYYRCNACSFRWRAEMVKA
jgi:DNA-binding response OmpR family regulator